jgi:dinuclear metal center YbgI/SA1388 family protein
LPTVASRDDIIEFLDELLDAPGWPDYGPNGLQVPGAPEVSAVVTGVSAHRELFERAVAAGAQLVLCHHGLFWGRTELVTPELKGRLKILFDADASLAAYHLPLDAHAEVGNNAQICGLLGFERSEPFSEHRGRPVGWVGRSEQGVPARELFERCGEVFGQEPLVFDAGPDLVRSIGIVSGGAASSIHEAVAHGLDAFLTGEPSEFVMASAREGRVHFIAGGHYATETFGIKRLGELLEDRFGVSHQFIEVPNPV